MSNMGMTILIQDYFCVKILLAWFYVFHNILNKEIFDQSKSLSDSASDSYF